MEHGQQRSSPHQVTSAHLWLAVELTGGATTSGCGNFAGFEVGGNRRGRVEGPAETQSTSGRDF